MKTSEVKIGQVYNVKVSGKVVAVRLVEEKWSGDKHVGWVGTNTETGRSVRVKSVRRLRGEVRTVNAEGVREKHPKLRKKAEPRALVPPPMPIGEIETRGEAAMTAEALDAPDAPPAPSDPAPANVGEPAANGAAKPRKPRAAKAPADPKPRKMSGLDAAAQVLAAATEPMSVQQILAEITFNGLWSSPNGKTPGATINAAIIREIHTKGSASRFAKTGRGLFAKAVQA